jgi:NADH-quinone oxidoreductase subunit L
LGGALGALLTGLYSFRLIFTVFFGPVITVPHQRRSPALFVPLAILSGLAVSIGWLQWPRELIDVHLFSRFLSSALPMADLPTDAGGLETAAVSLLSLLGIAVAAGLYLPTPKPAVRFAAFGPVAATARFWFEGWRFDRLYAWLVVRPWYRLTSDAGDRIDDLYSAVAHIIAGLHVLLSRTQTGQVRWYAASVAMGALVLIGWIAL